ncbi:Transcriptional regulator, AraC family [Pseudomonas sp. 8Z]|uniref:AraC family transcriptional regulator n=1 Tax=Pseudomonas sp. 8Z TaxID=2653166 RepID=UPI0012EF36CD|nr:AraC family transcriptional regulator [Pseudomonas sp. 8Z]VXD01618.1 Transcriptional regulator, AraC family [Pseudomonas sp. 8Z]
MEQINHIQSSLPGVRLIDAQYRRFAFPRHFHLEYHVGMLVQGQHRYVYGGERRHVGAGDVLLMAPEGIHDGACLDGSGYRIRVMAFDPHWLDEASRTLTEGRQGAPRLTTTSLRHPLLQQRLQHFHAAMFEGSRLAQESALWQALAQLLEMGSTLCIQEPQRAFDVRTWQQLRDWLESRLDDPPSLEEIAAFCAMSPWQALRRFRQHTGLPPHQWLTQLRLQRALPLVLAGESLSEIALRLGFYDQAHFSRLFRRTYGLPPARLRQG